MIFDCDSFPIKIGRSPEDNEIAIPYDDTASRDHAELTYDAGRVYIDDLRSMNSTFVNGTKIGGSIGKRSLNDGDLIKIGETYIKVTM